MFVAVLHLTVSFLRAPCPCAPAIRFLVCARGTYHPPAGFALQFHMASSGLVCRDLSLVVDA